MAESTAKKFEGLTVTNFSMKETIHAVENLENVSLHTKRECIIRLKRNRTLCLMACGLTGVGKSTLLNGIAGKYPFKVGHTGPETTEVATYTEKKENFYLILCDTPGFDDELEYTNEEIYLEDITRECANVDTLLYCISLDHTRIKLKQDLSTLKMLKQALNPQIWERCIIVLTFANAIVDKIQARGISETVNIKQEYRKIIKVWEEKVVETFSTAGIDTSTYKIPIVHAGVDKKLFIFEGDLGMTGSLPWLGTLWRAAYDKSSDDGQAVLFFFHFHRLKTCYTATSEVPPLPEQDIVVNMTFMEKIKKKLALKFPTIAAALATGGVAGVSGAGIGATIGALAIGIPSFGIAAGLGLLLGGVIGGGIGVGVGALTGKVIEKVRDKK